MQNWHSTRKDNERLKMHI